MRTKIFGKQVVQLNLNIILIQGMSFFKNSMEYSKEETSFTDKNFYKLSNFNYSINKEELKGEKI